ncbi:Cobalt-precorrin-6x reductase [Richelia intracellularis]|nr:Cobalt-precorrin-6x reductase [Richelia intracellularis]
MGQITRRLLILGGTGEAIQLAKKAANLPGLKVIFSLAGLTNKSVNGTVLTRIGGFGGVTGLIQYLRNEAIDLLIDATHPFAARISSNAATASHELGLPRLMLIRSQWESLNQDWIEVDSLESAAIRLQNQQAKRIFLAIGKQQLSVFYHLQNMWFLMRTVEKNKEYKIVPKGKLILAKGPFNRSEEKQLLLDYKIDTVVSKNSGGDATYGKILAAEELGVKVIMIQRPPKQKGETVVDVASAMEWLNVKLFENI